jgi:8-oxo-dGTP pyrophosphatase MutT (NUDIX family)
MNREEDFNNPIFITESPIIVRRIGTNILHSYSNLEELYSDGIKLSKYKPEDVLRFLTLNAVSNTITDNHYIVGPLYPKKNKYGKVKKDKYGNILPDDFQLVVTGKRKKLESLEEGAIREVGEEVGLAIKDSKYLQNKIKINKHTFFSCNIDDTVKIQYDKINEIYTPPYPYVSSKDHLKGKIGCVIYGSEESVLSYMVSDIVQWYNEDDIIGVVAVPYMEAISLLLDVPSIE